MKLFNTLSFVTLFISVSAGAAQLTADNLTSATLLVPLILNNNGQGNDDDDVTYHQCYFNPVSCFP